MFKIGIVDDDDTDREVLSRLVAEMEEPVETKEISSGRELLELLGSGYSPHVLFIDFNLQDYEGDQLVLDLKKFGYHNGLVLITGCDDHKQAKLCLDLGVHDYEFKDDLSAKRIVKCVYNAIQKSNYEKQVAEARIATEVASRNKTRFLAAMSHDIRTPLNGIIGSIELISRVENLSENGKKLLNIMSSSGNHLVDLVSDVLDISQIEENRVSINLDYFEVRESIQNTLQLFAHMAAQKKIILSYIFANEVDTFIKTDKKIFIQSLSNLISNSIKYTESGYVVLRVTKLKDRINCVVSDSGSGMAEEEVRYLFSDYLQFSNALDNKIKGTGLGLYITKKHLEELGGTVEVKSTKGEGSIFSIQIPCEFKQRRLNDYSSFLKQEVTILADESGITGKLLREILQERSVDKITFVDSYDQLDKSLISIADPKHPGFNGNADCGFIVLPSDGYFISQTCLYREMAGKFCHKPQESEVRSSLLTFSMKVLLVDDDATNRYIGEQFLFNFGCDVVSCENGKQACEISFREKFDLILMDMQMPVMGGIEATEIIQKRMRGKAPIVALTANVFAKDVEACLKAGALEVLEKPVRANALEKVLDRFGKRRST